MHNMTTTSISNMIIKLLYVDDDDCESIFQITNKLKFPEVTFKLKYVL